MKKLFTLLAALTIMSAANAQTDLIISEYVEGYSNNKAIEVFNPTNATINLKEYRLVRYANGEDTPPADAKWSMTFPDYELEPYKVYVAVLDKRDPNGTGQQTPLWWDLEVRADEFFNTNYSVSNTLYFNGDDAIALEKLDGTLVDLFGRWGAPCPADVLIAGSDRKEKDGAWTNVAPYYNGEGRGITADHTLVRKSNIKDGVIANPTLFNALAEYDTLVANTFTGLGWHKFDGAPANALPVVNMDTLYAVSPIAADGDVVLTINATDADADQKLEFYLTEGNTVRIGEEGSYEYLSPFKLERSTGKLIVADENAIAEATMDIYIEFVVCDEFGQTTPKAFKVRVTDEELGVENEAVKQIAINPNPAKNYFDIQADKEIATVQIFNLIGQELYIRSFNESSVRVNIDLTQGGYLVRTTYADGSNSIAKLIVE